jgi:uroporphyrinogen-III decarboxylase
MTEMYGGFTGVTLLPYGKPEVQAAFKNLMDAGTEAQKWIAATGAFDTQATANGFPNFFGGGCKVPFDTIGDTLRGTRGISVDMYRRPEKLLQALEAMTPIMVRMGASAAKANGNPLVFIPLHKGADGFLSDEQFKTFYWPFFKKLLLGLIQEGCVPFPWAEGGYNSRLEVIRDVPRGKTVWGFDTTDMARAKEVLGDVACIGGNLPLSILTVGNTRQVKDEVRKLIQTCARGGGYIMMNGAVLDDVSPANVRAMIEATREFGTYK